MADDIDEHIAEILAERANAPFGDTAQISDRLLQPFSRAGQEAASNLLIKAVRAIAGNDVERARGYVERAARLPFDRHAEQHPLASAAHMMLFDRVMDELETSDGDDARWLDAALTVLAEGDHAVRCELRDVLVAVDQEFDGITARERSRLRAGVVDVAPRAELMELDVDADELIGIVMSLVRAAVAYDAAKPSP